MDNNYNQQPNIFQQFYLSFVPPQYDRLTKVKTGSMIGFVTLLAFISTILIFAFLMVAFGTINVDMLPDFEIKEGQLSIEEDFVYDEEGLIYIRMTDDVGEFAYDDAYELALDGYFNIILVGRDRLSLMQSGQYQQLDFSEIERELGSSIVIDKDMVVSTFVSFVRIFFILGFVIFFVGRVFWYFLCAAVYLLFAMFIASVIMKKRLSSGTLFRVAVYAKVLMFTVTTFLIMVSFGGSVPFLFRVAITIAFMGFAIAKLPEEGWR